MRIVTFFPVRTVFGIIAGLTCALLLSAPAMPAGAVGESATGPFSPEDIQKQGQRMYREGILPSGETMQSVVSGTMSVPGTSFACISCHMLSGLGTYEGEIIVTPTNGGSLFSPRKPPRGIRSLMSGGMGMGRELPPEPPPGRPAYTDESLATVLRTGVDPAGRTLSLVMPRFQLRDRDMTILTAYLKSLSSRRSPGVDDRTLRFATVMSEDVPAGLRDKQAVLLEELLARMNEQARDYDRRLKDPKLNRHMSKTWRMQYRNLSLSRWLLKGPPETWPAQLEEYYRKEPVFALLGGIVSGEWKPVHDFCESNRIPALFPQTDLPVVSETNTYTFYLSKGYYQEGEAAARFIGRDSTEVRAVVQLARNSKEGRALAAGFEAARRDLGQPPAITVWLQTGESIGREALEKLLAKDRSATLLVWDGPEAMSLLASVAEMKNRPESVFVSAGYLGKKTTALPESVRDITCITYPYRLPRDEEQLEEFYLGSAVKNRGAADDSGRILKRTYPLSRILIQALAAMKDDFYRDYFLDVISNSKDLDVPLYERLSFGPGQRYASKGCYVVQLSPGTDPQFIKKSDWVIH